MGEAVSTLATFISTWGLGLEARVGRERSEGVGKARIGTPVRRPVISCQKRESSSR